MPTNRLRKSNKASLIHVEINFVGFKRQKVKGGHRGHSKLSRNHCTLYTFTYTSDMSVVLLIFWCDVLNQKNDIVYSSNTSYFKCMSEQSVFTLTKW